VGTTLSLFQSLSSSNVYNVSNTLGFRLGGTRSSRNNFPSLIQHSLKVVDRLSESNVDRYFWFPAKLSFCRFDVRATLLRIIRRLFKVDDLRRRFGQFLDVLGEFRDLVLGGVTKVDRLIIISIHQSVKTIHKITNVLERACLFTSSVNGNVLVLERLNDKVGDHASIVGVHAGSKGIEDTRNTHIDSILLVVTVHHRFGNTLSLIVASSRPDGVDISPVRFLLGRDFRISIDF